MLKTTNSPAKMPPNINTTRLVAETNPAYLQVSYHYDVQGCTNAASAGRARATDGAGRLLDRILSNGAITHYGWDVAGRLTRLKNTTITGQLVNDTAYSRDRLGNILSQTDDVQGCTNVAGAGCAGATTNALGQVTGTTVFSYDPEYRLKTADYPGSAFDEIFSYDKVGNRKTHTLNGSTKYYNYNAGNRLQDIRSGSPTGTVYESYQYDANGSLTNVSGNRAMTLSWDANNRVKQINSTQYRYDPSGYRIQKAAGQTNRYYLEGEHLEAVYDGNGALRDQYLRGTVIDEVVNGYHRDANNVMVNSTYHHDALQSVLGQSAHDGQIQATQSYTAFGGNLSGTGNSNAAQKYTGRESDGESGFYYYRARIYCPDIGRFISEDPLGFGAGVNFYTYCLNNPVNCNDPSGQSGVVGATIGLVSGGVAGFTTGYAQNGNFIDAAVGGSVGAILGGVVGMANPVLSASIGEVAAASLLGVTSNVIGQVAGNVSTNLINNQSIQPFSNFSTSSAITSGLGAPFSALNVYGSVTAATSSRALGVFSAGIAEGLSAASVELVGNQVGSLFNYMNSNNLPIGTPSSIFGSSIVSSLSSTQSASGGFVLYPNKANSNMMLSVYSK